MRINRIENNTNFNAKLNIISDSELLLKKDIATLTSKARNLGSKKDFITVGITEVTREKKEGKYHLKDIFLLFYGLDYFYIPFL